MSLGPCVSIWLDYDNLKIQFVMRFTILDKLTRHGTNVQFWHDFVVVWSNKFENNNKILLKNGGENAFWSWNYMFLLWVIFEHIYILFVVNMVSSTLNLEFEKKNKFSEVNISERIPSERFLKWTQSNEKWRKPIFANFVFQASAW